MRAALTVALLRHQFGARTALNGLDLTVQSGELLGLVGPNGAGKSTLLRCLLGLIQPTGSMEVLGLDPRRQPVAVRQCIAYLPGETSVYLQMTGKQFLAFALSFYPRQLPQLRRMLHEAFELPLDRKVRTYSAGMKQKLALLATLCVDVPCYVLDEPDRALDASVRWQLRDALRELKRIGKTIILSSHHLSELESLADRTEFVVAGRIVPCRVVQAARQRLARMLRLRLVAGTTLPPALQLLRTEGDLVQVVEARCEPLQALAELPPGSLLGAEIGIVRLEDLYQQLLDASDAETNA